MKKLILLTIIIALFITNVSAFGRLDSARINTIVNLSNNEILEKEILYSNPTNETLYVEVYFLGISYATEVTEAYGRPTIEIETGIYPNETTLEPGEQKSSLFLLEGLDEGNYVAKVGVVFSKNSTKQKTQLNSIINIKAVGDNLNLVKKVFKKMITYKIIFLIVFIMIVVAVVIAILTQKRETEPVDEYENFE